LASVEHTSHFQLSLSFFIFPFSLTFEVELALPGLLPDSLPACIIKLTLRPNFVTGHKASVSQLTKLETDIKGKADTKRVTDLEEAISEKTNVYY
jgi:hypothetical protein